MRIVITVLVLGAKIWDTYFASYSEAAPPFAVFEGWGPRQCSSITDTNPGLVIHTLHAPTALSLLRARIHALHHDQLLPRRPLLGSALSRDLFLEVLEQVRRRYRFVVVGYVVMPEHVHLLTSEPERGNPSVVIQAIKQSFARKLLRIRGSPPIKNRDGWGSLSWNEPSDERHIWQVRFYDFAVFTEAKKVEKLRYMHRNPVKRGLVAQPQDWKWSSFRYYACGEVRPVLVNEQLRAEMKIRDLAG